MRTSGELETTRLHLSAYHLTQVPPIGREHDLVHRQLDESLQSTMAIRLMGV